MKKTKVKMNKPIYLGLSILEISKTLMYEFWCDYMKPKYGDNVKLCYMDTDSFIMHFKTEDFYKDIANNFEKRFGTSNYDDECDRPLPVGKNTKVIRLMKDKLEGKIMTESVPFRPKTYSYLMDDESETKKSKGTKKCVTKRRLKFNDYKDCLLNNETNLKSQQRFKSERHDVYTKDINKIALSSNDDERLQTFDRITSYPYGTSAGKVCKTELQSKYKLLILMIILMKIKQNIIQSGHIFQIIHTEYLLCCGSGKTNALLNLINNQPGIDKIYLYAKDPCEAKYQYLTNKREKVGLDHFKDSKTFT